MLKYFKAHNPIIISTTEAKKHFNQVDYVLPGFNNSSDFFFKSLPFYLKCKRLLSKIKIQYPELVIYCPSFHPWNYLIGKIAIQLNITFTITVHDFKTHEGERKFVEHIQNKTIKLAHLNIFLTEHQRQLAIEYGVHPNMTTVLNHPLFSNLKNNTKPFNKTPNVLFVGRIKPYKGIDLLLTALKKISINKLTIAGEGRLGKIDVDNVEIINKKLSDKELQSLLESHEYLVLPYTHATQSGVLSMGLSKAINMIITDHPGLREQVSDKSVYWSKPTKEDLAKTLKEAFSNEKLYNEKKQNLLVEKQNFNTQWNISFNILIKRILLEL